MARRKPKFSRSSQPKSVRRRILILCEGAQTERGYFDGLKRLESIAAWATLVVRPGRGDWTKQRAIHDCARERKREQWDEIWCVFDTEHPSDKSNIDELQLLAREHDMNVCWSNPSFEVWLLAHFRRPGTPFLGCDAAKSALDAHWTSRFGCDYAKSDRQHLAHLARFEALRVQAIGNCEWVEQHHHSGIAHIADRNSSSNVYKLVRRLTQPDAT
jgi:RloB-like protein